MTTSWYSAGDGTLASVKFPEASVVVVLTTAELSAPSGLETSRATVASAGAGPVTVPETLAGNPPRRTSTPDLTCPAASWIAVAPSAVALSGYQICMKPAPVNSSLYDPGARPKNA